MSVKAVGHVFQRSPHTGTAFVIHLALAHAANAKGEVWMQRDNLAVMARCAPSTVNDVVKQMIDDGTLGILDRDKPKGRTRFLVIERPDLPVVWGKDDNLPPPSVGFAEFWKLYPPRPPATLAHGKNKTLEKWGKLDLNERRLCYKALKKYVAFLKAGGNGGRPKDPERFLANDFWRDLVDNEVVEEIPQRPRGVPSSAQWDPTTGRWEW